MFNRPLIRVIIPVLNEQERIAAALTGLEQQAREQNAEVIVVDGGSQDRTVEIARGFDFVRFTSVERANRGIQMNQGARMAMSETLLFLHADVELPAQAFDAVKRVMADGQVAGGCFQLRFPAGAPASLRLVAWGINLRTRWFRTATGDQAIFVRRQIFEGLGGYQAFPLMEDIDFFQRMKREGRVAVLNHKVEISPRRWLTYGIWRTVLLMYVLRAGYWMGIHPATLKRFFLDVR